MLKDLIDFVKAFVFETLLMKDITVFFDFLHSTKSQKLISKTS